MNIKASIKYQLNEYKKPVIIYYFVMFILLTVSIISTKLFSNGYGEFSGLEFCTIIFIFILGLNSFRESSKMMNQNGISRSTQFRAIISSIALLSLLMFVIDSVLVLLCIFLAPYVHTLQTFFDLLYPSMGFGFSSVLTPLFWQFALYFLAGIIGLVITVLYARMGKGGKISVSIAVPLFFFIIVPILAEEFGIRLLQPIVNFFFLIFGNSPYIDSLLFAVFGLIFTGICYSMTRRATFD